MTSWFEYGKVFRDPFPPEGRAVFVIVLRVEMPAADVIDNTIPQLWRWIRAARRDSA